MIKLSFIVPVFNVEPYISCCIESLAQQNMGNDNIEIILVDDGSTDGSLKICRKYEKEFKNIRVLHQENKGANVARNLGLDCAVGEWICFVDSDDWTVQSLYRTLLPEMDKNWDIIMYAYKKVYPKKIKSGTKIPTYLEIYKDEFRELELATLNRFRSQKYNISVINVVNIWNKLYRRQFLSENHLKFNADMPKLQDLEFNLNVYKYAKSAVCVDKELYYYRMNENSVTHRYQSDIIEKFNIINKSIERFVKDNFSKDMEEAYYERIATHMRTIVVRYLCNKKNEKKYFVRKKGFLELLETEPYFSAMKRVDLSNFPFKERVLSIAIKYHNFAGCTLLCKLEEILNAYRY